MERRTFLQLAAVAPIAALAVWRPPAIAERRSVDWDLARGRDWTALTFTVWGAWGVDQMSITLPRGLRYTRLEYRGPGLTPEEFTGLAPHQRNGELGISLEQRARVVVQASPERDGLWSDIAVTFLPDGPLYRVRLDETYPLRWTRELHVGFSA